MTDVDERAPAAVPTLDLREVEGYVRDSKLVVTTALAYVVLVSAYGVLRVVLDVPYLRAAIGLYLAVVLLAVLVKRRLAPGRDRWFLASAGAGLAVGVPALLALVAMNRGTLFAEAASALVALTVVHGVDRVALARA